MLKAKQTNPNLTENQQTNQEPSPTNHQTKPNQPTKQASRSSSCQLEANKETAAHHVPCELYLRLQHPKRSIEETTCFIYKKTNETTPHLLTLRKRLPNRSIPSCSSRIGGYPSNIMVTTLGLTKKSKKIQKAGYEDSGKKGKGC